MARGDGRRATRSARPSTRSSSTPRTRTVRFRLPWTFSTFDYRELCALLFEQCDAEFETATVEGRSATTVHTDRGDLAAPLVVDALGWKRVLAGNAYQPPEAPLSRGLEVHPARRPATSSRSGSTAATSPPGYSWSFPARDEVRIGVGSFDPRFHVKEPTVRLADDLDRDAVRYQGNWIPHKLRSATGDGIFFVGDSAGHCLPLTAEGIRTAFYFGIACGRELRRVVEGAGEPRERTAPLRAISPPRTSGSSGGCCACSELVPRVPPRVLAATLRANGDARRSSAGRSATT